MNAPTRPTRMKDAEALSGPLDPRQMAEYRRMGWVVARGFFPPAEAQAIAAWTDELTARPEVPGEHMVYREDSLTEAGRRVIQRIENFCPYHPGFDGLVREGRLARAIDQLLGGEACLFKEKINFKEAGGAGFEPHQDQQAGWSTYADLFVTALVGIDRATMENGCLEMANVTRLPGMIGPEWRPLSAAEMAGFDLVPTPTEPGDVIFFDSYVPHASKPNLTKDARRILYLTYNRLDDGDHRQRYFSEKRANFPRTSSESRAWNTSFGCDDG